MRHIRVISAAGGFQIKWVGLPFSLVHFRPWIAGSLRGLRRYADVPRSPCLFALPCAPVPCSKADDPCKSIGELIMQKMGEKIKSK